MEPIVACKNLFKVYHSGGSSVKAVNDLIVSVNQGEFVMITGRNGSGKSTLLHLLALLDQPDKGEVFVLNEPTSHLSEAKKMDFRLRQLGYIFQEYALIAELSALENVMLPSMMLNTSQVAKKKALDILDKLELSNKLNRLPSELSGGEQQRVAIARALINDPKVIFADEPTANLDTVSSKHILEIFKALNEKENITIIMVTHEPEELFYASRQIKLSDGRLA
ncbi:MAG: ABC transporter ATP-binding protein [Patescibacteria group bacterium]|jgi:putative ABC transport system ATP-binding protein